MADRDKMYVAQEGDLFVLRQERFRAQLAKGQEHPHDQCAVARSVEEMHSMADKHWPGADYSAVSGGGANPAAQTVASQELVMVIDLDERGSFKGHVTDQTGATVFEFSNEDETGWPSEDGFWLVEDGFMKHGCDVAGLHEYLKQMGIAAPSSTIRLEG